MPTVEEVLRTGPVLSEASIFERLRRTPGIEFEFARFGTIACAILNAHDCFGGVAIAQVETKL